MTLDDLIEYLTDLRAQGSGDLPVYICDWSGTNDPACRPCGLSAKTINIIDREFGWGDGDGPHVEIGVDRNSRRILGI
jgi:hypothetical protein